MGTRWIAGITLALWSCSSSDDDAAGSPQGSPDAAGDAVVTLEAGGDAPGVDAGVDAGPTEPQVLFPKTGFAPDEIGVLVNDQDPDSVEIGNYYAQQRGIPAANVVTLSIPTGATLSETDFGPAKAQLDAALGSTVQALAIAWTQPYRVACMSVTTAFGYGFDKKFCNTTGGSCGATAPVAYFGSDSLAPFTDFGTRPAMMLAAKSVDEAKALIDRGIAADDTYPTGDGYLIRTTDTARSVRWPAFVQLTQNFAHDNSLSFSYIDNSDGNASNAVQNTNDILFYFTGLAKVPGVDTNGYRPGAVADHLTSYGGQVPTSGQMSVVEWLSAGVTGSYGTVVEPCNYTSKFPDPTVLVPRYYAGATLLEAYAKSVKTPGEGLFVGEPLARPWGTPKVSFDGTALLIETTALVPGKTYRVEGADTESGPWTSVQSDITAALPELVTLTISPADRAYYRLSEQ